MGMELDQRLNGIQESLEQCQRAQVLGDHAEAGKHVAQGLASACLLLQSLEADTVLKEVHVSEAGMRLVAVTRTNRDLLKEFLKVERALLSVTKLTPKAVDSILQGVELLLQSALVPKSYGHWALKRLAKDTCEAARQQQASIERRPLLKRAFAGAGGAMLAVMNIVPPFAIPQQLQMLSPAVGMWLVGAAADNHLSQWFEK